MYILILPEGTCEHEDDIYEVECEQIEGYETVGVVMRYCGKYGWDDEKQTDTCESTVYEVPNEDICEPNPCNYGICMKSDESLFSCSCWDGYEGDRCNEEVNECRGNPCERGLCIDGINSYECDCPTRYDGEHCEISLKSKPEFIRRTQFVFDFRVPDCVAEDDDLFKP
eukprot:UN32369